MINAVTRRALLYPTKFKPTDVTGCKLWLDFSDRNTLFTDAGTVAVSADGDAIYQANDKSGNNNHAVQSDVNYRPAYKVNIKNGLSAARFDGYDAVLKTSNLVEATYYSLFAICNRTGGDNFSGPLTMDGVTSTNYRLFQFRIDNVSATKTAQLVAFNSVKGAFTDSQAITMTNLSIMSGIRGSNYVQIWVNGVSDGSTATTGTPMTVTDYAEIGQSLGTAFSATDQYLGGDICEVIIYTSALSDTDRSSVENYLNAKWSIY